MGPIDKKPEVKESCATVPLSMYIGLENIIFFFFLRIESGWFLGKNMTPYLFTCNFHVKTAIATSMSQLC